MDLVERVYEVTRGFPKNEVYALCSQMQRAAVSVPSNIAEGHEREHIKEYLHHLSMAQASLAELETQLEISLRLGYIQKEKFNQLFDFAQPLGRQLRSLRNSLTRTQTALHPVPGT
jgi:four helix bundle protein